MHRISKALENKNRSVVIALDISKAFDKMDVAKGIATQTDQLCIRWESPFCYEVFPIW